MSMLVSEYDVEKGLALVDEMMGTCPVKSENSSSSSNKDAGGADCVCDGTIF